MRNCTDLEKSNDIFFNFGKKDFGPLIYGFSKWLEGELEKENITRVYFLSRDGHYMKRVFDFLAEPEFESHYLYASRRLLQVASICDKQDYDSVVKTMYFPRYFRGEKLIKSWGCKSVLDKAPTALRDKEISRDDLLKLDDFKEFFESNYDAIIENSLNEKKALCNYLKMHKFQGKVAIVDIGWFGNMQNSLETIIDNSDIECEIYGYYLGVNPESQYFNKYKMKGFMFEPGVNKSFYNKEQFFENVLEVFFSAPHGSAIKYYYEDAEIKVLLDDNDYVKTESFKNVVKIQDGAFQYCGDRKFDSVNDYEESSLEYSNKIFKDLCAPSKKIVNSIGRLYLDDDNLVKLIEAKKTRYYILHPKRLMRDFIDSYWKVGFLKKVFKINLPYASLLAIVKRVV